MLAITLLPATLPAQCEKLSTLKPDSVHRQSYIPAQVLSNDTKVMKCGYTSSLALFVYGANSASVCACVLALRIKFFGGTPDDSAAWTRAYPKPLHPSSALVEHPLQSGDRGRVSVPAQM